MPDDKIFFTEFDAEGMKVKFMDPDGSNVQTFASVSYNIPVIAPNPALTQYFFFYTPNPSATSPVYDLYRNTSPQFAGATRMTSDNFDFPGTIQVTPDGSKVVFTASRGELDFGVYTINASGTGKVRIGNGEEAYVAPNGSKLVITRVIGGVGDIGICNLDGTAFTNLTSSAFEDFSPQWSKDGAHIFYASDAGGNFNIFRVASSGGVSLQITSAPEDEFGPSPNHTGTRVSFVVGSGSLDDYGVYVVDTAGTNRSPLYLNSGIGDATFWTPIDGVDSGGYAGLMFGRKLSPRIAARR